MNRYILGLGLLLDSGDGWSDVVQLQSGEMWFQTTLNPALTSCFPFSAVPLTGELHLTCRNKTAGTANLMLVEKSVNTLGDKNHEFTYTLWIEFGFCG